MGFLKSLRKIAKPLLIAANKADLCDDLKIIEKISTNFKLFPLVLKLNFY